MMQLLPRLSDWSTDGNGAPSTRHSTLSAARPLTCLSLVRRFIGRRQPEQDCGARYWRELGGDYPRQDKAPCRRRSAIARRMHQPDELVGKWTPTKRTHEWLATFSFFVCTYHWHVFTFTRIFIVSCRVGGGRPLSGTTCSTRCQTVPPCLSSLACCSWYVSFKLLLRWLWMFADKQFLVIHTWYGSHSD